MKKYPHGLTLNAVCAAIDDYQRHEDSVPEEGILAAFNTLLGHSDIADALRSMERTADVNMAAAQAMRDDMYHWKQRAEAAEAIVSDVNEIIGLLTEREWAEHCTKTETGKLLEELITDLHDDASPASGLAELVPDEFTNDEVPCAMTDVIQAEMDGWNACRAAILRNIEEAK